MIVQEVAKKYATALFMSTKERGLIDQAYDQLGSVRLALERDRSLLIFLSSPSVDDEQKQSVVRSIFSERMERLFVEFLVVLVKKHRAQYLPEIIDEFTRHVEFEKGIIRVTVITAVPLTPEEETKLILRLKAMSSGTVELEKKIDLSIWGGMIVILHDQIIDGSVRHGIDLVEDKLQKVRVH